MYVGLATFAGMVEASNALFCTRQRTTNMEPLDLIKQCERDVYCVYNGLEHECTPLETRTVLAIIKSIEDKAMLKPMKVTPEFVRDNQYNKKYKVVKDEQVDRFNGEFKACLAKYGEEFVMKFPSGLKCFFLERGTANA